MPLEPLADGQVVEFQAGPGQTDGKQENRDIHENARAERSVGIPGHPGHLHIDQRVVGDVEREGDFAEERADGHRPGAGDTASGPHRDDQRENEQDDQRLIAAVDPRGRNTPDMGHDQSGRDQQRAPPESARTRIAAPRRESSSPAKKGYSSREKPM